MQLVRILDPQCPDCPETRYAKAEAIEKALASQATASLETILEAYFYFAENDMHWQVCGSPVVAARAWVTSGF
jgi:hypothetical protein